MKTRISLDVNNTVEDLNVIDADIFLEIFNSGVSFDEYEYEVENVVPGRLGDEIVIEKKATSDALEVVYNSMTYRKFGKDAQMKMTKEIIKDFI